MPREEPAIVALRDTGRVKVYVSWNGDTRTKWWRFWEVRGKGKGGRLVVGKVKRESFETVLTVDKQSDGVDHKSTSGGAFTDIRYQAEALDALGRVLVTTEAVGSDVLIKQFRANSQAKIGNGEGVSQPLSEKQKVLGR